MRLTALLLVLLLYGCASLSGEDRYWLKPMQFASDDGVSLLYYAHYVRELPAAERERELQRQQVAFAKDKSSFRRVQYALAVLAGQPALAERRLAAQLIEPVIESSGHNSVQALAELIDAQLQGLRRADELEKKLSAMREIERNLMQRERGRQ